MNELEHKYLAIIERERAARHEAEALLEQKSSAYYRLQEDWLTLLSQQEEAWTHERAWIHHQLTDDLAQELAGLRFILENCGEKYPVGTILSDLQKRILIIAETAGSNALQPLHQWIPEDCIKQIEQFEARLPIVNHVKFRQLLFRVFRVWPLWESGTKIHVSVSPDGALIISGQRLSSFPESAWPLVVRSHALGCGFRICSVSRHTDTLSISLGGSL